MIIPVSKEKQMSEETGKSNTRKFAQLPIKDLIFLNFITEANLIKYYTGETEYVSYGLVELMLDSRVQNRDWSRHELTSYEDRFVISWQFLFEQAISNSELAHITVASDILNLSDEEVYTLAKDDNGLYKRKDEEEYYVTFQWLVDKYMDWIEKQGIEADISLLHNNKDKVKLIIKRIL
ncbi:hypothetical protein PO183_01640 [Bacteroides ovatus]|jgi:hypothetical protein|uniref:hypothetical protein n=1 Tax=Bacteroides ovatus TaxID=28116 RepID=UPI00233EA454|nr:hypothetical protein [Bacteroides ovatus]MDC2364852.1 hypothetical protein [Bacteroides ovatus]